MVIYAGSRSLLIKLLARKNRNNFPQPVEPVSVEISLLVAGLCLAIPRTLDARDSTL
jgi:hypothetical protein